MSQPYPLHGEVETAARRGIELGAAVSSISSLSLCSMQTFWIANQSTKLWARLNVPFALPAMYAAKPGEAEELKGRNY